ncbi:MAG: tagatose 1,6-diphosphate aldolase [Chloroflexota bacterium]
MTTSLVGVYRALSQCSDDVFSILALDHRANLVAELQKYQTSPVTYDDVVSFKTAVLRNLGEHTTAVLIDPDYGLPGLAQGVIPQHVGMLAPLEVTDYTLDPAKRTFYPISGWDVAKLKQAGFNGAKLLIYFHPDAANVSLQTKIVARTIEACRKQQVPLFLEPINYALDSAQPLTGVERIAVAVETAHHFSEMGVDVLKLEFPTDDPDERTWQPALQALNAACSMPWTLLSAGVSFERFEQQAKAACQAGASGVIAGRAVWSDAIPLQGEERETFLGEVGSERMRRLTTICKEYGHSWTDRHPPLVITEGWYRETVAAS